MELTDNELGMIEQLTYLHGGVADAAGLDGNSGVTGEDRGLTIAQILADYDEEALEKLEQAGDKDLGFVSAKEWAGIIRYLKNSRMKDLVLVDTMKNKKDETLALCFAQKPSDAAVVAFRGTKDGEEWIDNVEGLNESDTVCQKNALDFIESLPYGDITVTGHSKGGNKAMYVAITSDKVTRCVSYDGQGFSQEFVDKYWAEIQANSGKITAYSLSTDYVHALMFPVPNSQQIYCQGNGVANIGEHHSPNSFYVTDENGHIVLDQNGNPIMVHISEDESIVMLHEFTAFVINNADDADKEQIIGFVSKLLSMAFSGDEKDKAQIVNYCMSNTDTLAIIIAYLAKYMDVNDLSSQDIDKLLDMLGLDALDEMFTMKVGSWKIAGLSDLIDQAKQHLNDDDDDFFITAMLSVLDWGIPENVNIDLAEFWKKIDSKVQEIDTSNGCGDAVVRTGIIRDFSRRVYGVLMNSINQIEALGGISTSSWNGYQSEEWFSPLLIGVAIKGINSYFSRITEANQQSKIQIETVFDQVESIDKLKALSMETRYNSLESSASKVTSVASSIG